MTPRCLDLFSGAGGAAVGYAQAGFDVNGVDNVPRPSYPFDMRTADALDVLRELIGSGHVRRFALIHASPPCQAECALTAGTNAANGWGGGHVELLTALRLLLAAADRPYVIEQPIGKARIRKDVTLCGEAFGLDVIRHRNFELGGWSTAKPIHVAHRGKVRGWRHGVYFDGPYVAAYGNGGGKASVPEMKAAMRIDWTDDRSELTEAIPPAYTRWLGEAFMRSAVSG